MIGIVGLDDGSHGAEQFIPECRHVGFYVSQAGRLVEVPFVCAASQESRSGCARLLNLGIDQFALRSSDERADNKVGITRITNLQSLDLGHESFEEGIVASRLHDDAGTRHANLPLMDEYAEAGGCDGIIEIGVLKHNQRAFPTKLQDHLLAVLGAFYRNALAYGSRTSERN